jgi:hypothetical protein
MARQTLLRVGLSLDPNALASSLNELGKGLAFKELFCAFVVSQFGNRPLGDLLRGLKNCETVPKEITDSYLPISIFDARSTQPLPPATMIKTAMDAPGTIVFPRDHQTGPDFFALVPNVHDYSSKVPCHCCLLSLAFVLLPTFFCCFLVPFLFCFRKRTASTSWWLCASRRGKSRSEVLCVVLLRLI